MRTLKTPAVMPSSASPTATLWDTPVPVTPASPPVSTLPVSKPAAGIEGKPDEPPFDTPEDVETESPAQPKPLKSASVSIEQMADQFGLGELLKREHELLEPIFEAHRSILALEERILELSNELKDCEHDLNIASDSRAALLQSLPDRLFAIRTGKSPESTKPVSTPKPTSTPVVSEAWRSVATSTITEGVPGLGDKKAIKLTEEFPTLGDLCDAMARAITKRCHFADELPKGIGKQSADELANRVMAAQTKHNEVPASEAVEPRRKKVVSHDSEPMTDVEHSEFITTLLESIKAGATRDTLTSDRGETWQDGYEAAMNGEPAQSCPKELQQAFQADWVRGWLAFQMFGDEEDTSTVSDASHQKLISETIQRLMDNLTELSVKNAKNKEVWQVGYDANYEGVDATECPADVIHTSEPLATTAELITDWLRGWVSAEVEMQKKEQSVIEANNAKATPAKPVETPTVELDDIGEIAERIKAESNRAYQVSEDAWQDGYNAAADGRPIETFPHDLPGEELLDWVRGYVVGTEDDFQL